MGFREHKRLDAGTPSRCDRANFYRKEESCHVATKDPLHQGQPAAGVA